MFRQQSDCTDVFYKLCDLPVLLSALSLLYMNNLYRASFPQGDLGAYKHLLALSPRCRWLLFVDKLFAGSENHCHKLQSTQTID